MNKCILVVEDLPDDRQILRDMLACADYQVLEAENGEQALASLAKQCPDLILMDLKFPIADALETTRRIKADPSLCSIPIIAALFQTSIVRTYWVAAHHARAYCPTQRHQKSS